MRNNETVVSCATIEFTYVSESEIYIVILFILSIQLIRIRVASRKILPYYVFAPYVYLIYIYMYTYENIYLYGISFGRLTVHNDRNND